VLLLGALTIAMKALGPVVFEGRTLSARQVNILGHLAPALFAALIVTAVFARGRAIALDARAAGLAVALLGAQRRASPILILVAAVAVTAAVRHLL
jgi:branched-subunit amino acid transport protein